MLAVAAAAVSRVRLFDILACPICKREVKLAENKIVCQKCGRKYPIRDGIPIMLEEEAEREGDRKQGGK